MNNQRWIFWICLAVFLWGSVHALGAYLFNHRIERALMVMLCVDVFLGSWLALLLGRKAKLQRLQREAEAWSSTDAAENAKSRD